MFGGENADNAMIYDQKDLQEHLVSIKEQFMQNFVKKMNLN